ncbi:MAG TPA: MmcQ/YjbR family DNA-binding protein [Streptosporangiaceae bacterium]
MPRSTPTPSPGPRRKPAARPPEAPPAGVPRVFAEEIRRVALSLPRAYEAEVRGRVKFRVGRIVFVALSRDELTMGCGFPREERAAMVAAEPEKFFLPIPSEMRYQWIEVHLTAIDVDEMAELVTDAWRMCVPKRVAADHLGPVAGHG